MLHLNCLVHTWTLGVWNMFPFYHVNWSYHPSTLCTFKILTFMYIIFHIVFAAKIYVFIYILYLNKKWKPTVQNIHKDFAMSGNFNMVNRTSFVKVWLRRDLIFISYSSILFFNNRWPWEIISLWQCQRWVHPPHANNSCLHS